MKNNLLKIKGFTLVEIMVATSIFMLIMIVALGALITSSDTAKKAQALRTSMDNVSFAMESMTRSLRMGSNYTCVGSISSPISDSSLPVDCASGNGILAFVPYTNVTGTLPRTVAYVWDGTNKKLQRCTTSCVDMVSSDVQIDYMKFFLNGSSISGTVQPGINILVRGTVTIKNQPTSF